MLSWLDQAAQEKQALFCSIVEFSFCAGWRAGRCDRLKNHNVNWVNFRFLGRKNNLAILKHVEFTKDRLFWSLLPFLRTKSVWPSSSQSSVMRWERLVFFGSRHLPTAQYKTDLNRLVTLSSHSDFAFLCRLCRLCLFLLQVAKLKAELRRLAGQLRDVLSSGN